MPLGPVIYELFVCIRLQPDTIEPSRFPKVEVTFSFGVERRQCLAELLQRPIGLRLRRDVVVKNLSPTQFREHEHIQDSESGGDRDEEIAGHNSFGRGCGQRSAIAGSVPAYGQGIPLQPGTSGRCGARAG